MEKRRYFNLLNIFNLCLFILVLLFSSRCNLWACDVAVISASASTNNRPFIWKNRDWSPSFNEEMSYFEVGGHPEIEGYTMIYNRTVTYLNCSGGANNTGFAIALTAVYDPNTFNEMRNANTSFTREALETCVTLDDFENFLDRWHRNHARQTISGNFAVIDAHGGAAMYECWTGSFAIFSNRIRYYKVDANTGRRTYKNGRRFRVIDEGEGENFIGFINLTNTNAFIKNYGEERRYRAQFLMEQMRKNERLNYRNVMIEVAKDVIDGRENGEQKNNDLENYNTTFCISRSATRFGMVVDGVASGDDPKATTIWCNIGEPSIGVFTPHFPSAKRVSFYYWADRFSSDSTPLDRSSTCFMSMAFNKRETIDALLYSSNRGNTSSGMYDKTINKLELSILQEWTFPLEETIVLKTEEFLEGVRNNPDGITDSQLYDFSHYCAIYAYKNYINGSDTSFIWNFLF